MSDVALARLRGARASLQSSRSRHEATPALALLVDDVIGSAEASADPALAYGSAAHYFRDFARRPENVNVARALIGHANGFAARAAQSQRRVTVDDFEELEAEAAQAHREVGSFGDLEVRARRNEIHAAKRTSNRVSIAPRSFTESTPLGRSATIKFQPSSADVAAGIQQSATVAMWTGTLEETQALTVDIGVSAFPAPGSGVSCRAQAVITYGTDGFQQSVTVDVGLGQRITVPGNMCIVLVQMLAPYAGLPSGVMTVGATISPFAAPSQSPVVLTAFVDQVNGVGFPSNIPRPNRAQAIWPPPQCSDLTGTVTGRFLFQDAAGTLLYALPTFVPGTIVAPIPLTGDVALIVLQTTATNPVNWRIPLALSL